MEGLENSVGYYVRGYRHGTLTEEDVESLTAFVEGADRRVPGILVKILDDIKAKRDPHRHDPSDEKDEVDE